MLGLSTNSTLITTSKFNGVAGVDGGFALDARDEKSDDMVVANAKSSQDFSKPKASAKTPRLLHMVITILIRPYGYNHITIISVWLWL